MPFYNLIKFWEKTKSSQCSHEEYIEAAREILALTHWGFFEPENPENLKAFGPIFLPVVKSATPLKEKLQKEFKDKHGIDFSSGDYLLINIPHYKLGSAAYVAFELKPQGE